MVNWSTDEKEFKKKNPQEYKLWRLTQLINYGLDGEKLERKFLELVQAENYFNYYPFPRINVGQKWGKISIDSVEDIAVNKVHTISVKPKSLDNDIFKK